jgi:two-component system nitrate/nitrite response regulator NarL
MRTEESFPASSQRGPITVIAADQQPIFCEGVARAVRGHPQLALAAEVADGRAALRAITELKPDVAVLDIGLPQLSGPAVLNAVAREELPTRVILLAADLDAQVAYDVYEAGAKGLVSKDAPPEELCRAIVAVAEGRKAIPPELVESLTDEIELRGRHERRLLSDRERQVLNLLAEGLSARRIAEKLFLSPYTIKTHQAHLYEKLGVSDRAAAVREAMRRGLIE